MIRRALVVFAVLLPAPAFAEKGDLVLQFGAVHIRPQESSQPLKTELRPNPLYSVVGIEESFESPGTSARVTNSETVGMTLKYFVTDDLALKVEGGLPVEFDIHANGVVRPTGITGELINVDLGAAENNPIASARQWSPLIMGQYHLGNSQSRLRPYFGLGVTYTWFTDVELNDNLKDNINNSFGRTLALAAGKPGPTSTSADAEAGWAPVFNFGIGYKLSENWGIDASVSYLALKTEAAITIEAEDGTQLAESTTKLDLNPVAIALLASYRF